MVWSCLAQRLGNGWDGPGGKRGGFLGLGDGRFEGFFGGGLVGFFQGAKGVLCKGWEGGSLRIRCKYVFDSFHSLGVPFCLWIFILGLIFGNNPWHGGVKGCWDGDGAQKQQGVLGDGMDLNGVSLDPDQGQDQ